MFAIGMVVNNPYMYLAAAYSNIRFQEVGSRKMHNNMHTWLFQYKIIETEW